MQSAFQHHDEPSLPARGQRPSPAGTIGSSAGSDPPLAVLRYIDVVLIVVAAPILLLIGVSASGYAAGAGAWIALRAVGVVVEHYAGAARAANQEITLRLSYLLTRLFLLALAVILARQGDGRGAGLTALVVIVFAFTVEMIIGVANRPRPRAATRPRSGPGNRPPSRPAKRPPSR